MTDHRKRAGEVAALHREPLDCGSSEANMWQMPKLMRCAGTWLNSPGAQFDHIVEESDINDGHGGAMAWLAP